MKGLTSMLLPFRRGRRSSALPGFDPEFYLAENPDVRQAGMDPWRHFEVHGWKEHRNPSRGFSTAEYLAANPDVTALGLNPLEHFILHGFAEGRSPVGRNSAAETQSAPQSGSDTEARIAQFHRADAAQRGRIV